MLDQWMGIQEIKKFGEQEIGQEIYIDMEVFQDDVGVWFRELNYYLGFEVYIRLKRMIEVYLDILEGIFVY